MQTKKINEIHIQKRGLYHALTSAILGLAMKKYRIANVSIKPQKVKQLIQTKFSPYFTIIGKHFTYTLENDYSDLDCKCNHFIFGESGITLSLCGKIVAHVTILNGCSLLEKYFGTEYLGLDLSELPTQKGNYERVNLLFTAKCENGKLKVLSEDNQLFEFNANIPNGNYYVRYSPFNPVHTRIFAANKITPQFEMFKTLGII